MGATRLIRVQSESDELNRVQSNVESAMNGISGPFIGGNLLTSVTLTSGQDNVIPHKLGKHPQIWVLSDQNTNTTVWRTAWNTNTITLKCGSSCTVNIWVN